MGQAPERNVLIVDDEPQVRSALARLVREEGFKPVIAATAEEALALSQDLRFVSVISDVRMPGMGGLALLQRLSPMQQGARFLIVTGNGPIESEVLPRGHRIRVFSKPWVQEELVEALHERGGTRESSLPPTIRWRPEPNRVLLIEDDDGDAVLFKTALRMTKAPFEVIHVRDLAAALLALEGGEFDVVAVDLGLPDAGGLQTIAKLQAQAPHIGLVILSGLDDAEFALEAVKVGAQDYLVKGKVGGASIVRALRYAKERKQAELRLSEIAFHDQLTGLANRTLFRQRVAHALSRARRNAASFAILLLDMDRFKAINDAFGHDGGDTFLQHVARRLQQATRDSDTIARLGGDEFAVLLDPLNATCSVETFCERILDGLHNPIEISGTKVWPTASIGVATYPQSGEDGDALLIAADVAMYVVKDEGRNGYHVHGQELSERMANRVHLEGRLRQAIELNQMALFYQPQVELGGNFLGVEALLRWQTDDGHTVPAKEFIAILEDSELIVELGPWIVETACRQLRRWRDEGYQVDRIGVNLSPRQLTRGKTVSALRTAVDEFRLTPADVELEVTESTLSRQVQDVSSLLIELTQAGFRLALDDFGTGSSSLTQLCSFPFSTVKIDASQIAGLGSPSRQCALIGGVIQLARRLDLNVVAEGVETEAQKNALQLESGIKLQGHLIGPALSPAEFRLRHLLHQLSA